MKPIVSSLAVLLAAAATVQAQAAENTPGAPSASDNPSRIEIDLGRRGAEVPASLYGIFFEEISGSGDGGLYAEMLRNRGFEEGTLPSGCTLDADGFAAAPHLPCYSNDSINRFRVRWSPDRAMIGWRTQYADGSQAASVVTDEYPLNAATPHALRLDLEDAYREVSAVNGGYWGIAVEAGKTYDLEFYVRAEETPWCRATLATPDGEVVARADRDLTADGEWHRYTATFIPTKTGTTNSLHLTFPNRGRVWIDFVSLFPRDTYKNRPNGLRRDVAEMIVAMHPAFLRWPGGCIVEGLTLENRVKWKETIGPAVSRPGEYNLWGYRSSFGLGYHEFLQFCEDIGADAMFVCNAGMSCLFRNGDYVEGDALEPLIQEALDAIEYALGDAETTKWGAERAKNGHREPFPLKYVEIGNENVFGRYAANYNRFHRAIKARYPQLTLITALMFSRDLERLDEAEVIDPHYYETPAWFYNNADVYDKLPKNFPYRVYIGEYAAVGRSDLYAALSEAAFLTGAERNGDKVQMLSFAPLLQNAHFGHNHMIVFDNARAYGRSNYHVVKLFSENRPDYNVACRIAGETIAEPLPARGSLALGTMNAAVEFRDLKLRQNGKTTYATDFGDLDRRWEPLRGEWSAADGTLRQPRAGGEALLRLRDVEAGDFTLTFKARRTAGREGFRIWFGMPDDRHGYLADFGGYGNESVLFREAGDEGTVSLFDYRNQEMIRTDQWYDVRLEVRGNVWKCYLDDRLVETHRHHRITRHYAVAGIDRACNELVVKMVNAQPEPWRTTLSLRGGRITATGARRIELGSASMRDENSLDAPEKIAPRTSTLRIEGRSTPVECPPNTLTILRIPLRR